MELDLTTVTEFAAKLTKLTFSMVSLVEHNPKVKAEMLSDLAHITSDVQSFSL